MSNNKNQSQKSRYMKIAFTLFYQGVPDIKKIKNKTVRKYAKQIKNKLEKKNKKTKKKSLHGSKKRKGRKNKKRKNTKLSKK